MPTIWLTKIPPLEAQALGCPVMISGTYGMLLEQSGDAAVYIDPTSVDSIAGALKILWKDDNYCGTSLRDKGYACANNGHRLILSTTMKKILSVINIESF